jgi:hypothetical protein
MHGLAPVEVVEEQRDRLVIDVRYLYRDRKKNARGDGLGREGSDYGKRRFTFVEEAQGFEEVEMTGSQRTAGMA